MVNTFTRVAMKRPPTRVSHCSVGIGPKIPVNTVADLVRGKATHVSFHSNRIQSLEVPMRQRGRSKDADIRIVSEENCLEHVVELDLSSNDLNEGCELSQHRIPSRFSILSMSPKLSKLNISSNGLTAKSLRALICIQKSDGGVIPLLPSLKQLDVSNNNMTSFPEDMPELFPSLTQIVAMNNKIKSLTSLLQTLYNFRGRLESVHLFNRSAERNNPVCQKTLYREKIIFVLGSTLKQLDGVKIKTAERNTVRLTLARDYQIEFSNDNHCYEMPEQSPCTRAYNDLCSDENVTVDSPEHSSSPDHSKDKQISNLELQLQVVSLSALVEKQTHHFNNLLRASRDYPEENEIAKAPAVDTEKHKNDGLDEKKDTTPNNKPDEANDSTIKRQKLALATAVLRTTLWERRHRTIHLRLAFCRWKLQTDAIDYSSQTKAMVTAARQKWQKIRKEYESNKRKLSLSIKAEQVAHNKSSELTRSIHDLQRKLQDEAEKIRESTKESDCKIAELENSVRQLSTALKDNEEEHISLVKRLRMDLDVSATELRGVKEELVREKTCRASIESARQLTNKEAQDRVASCKSENEELKIELVQKDVRALSSIIVCTANEN